MLQGKTLTIVLVNLIVGFTGGFLLRPFIILPAKTVAVDSVLARAATSQARGTQYFAAHIGEARQVVAGCRDGTVRGGECATAEEAIIKVEAQERRKRFLGN